jgi:hypothetical protein
MDYLFAPIGCMYPESTFAGQDNKERNDNNFDPVASPEVSKIDSKTALSVALRTHNGIPEPCKAAGEVLCWGKTLEYIMTPSVSLESAIYSAKVQLGWTPNRRVLALHVSDFRGNTTARLSYYMRYVEYMTKKYQLDSVYLIAHREEVMEILLYLR